MTVKDFVEWLEQRKDVPDILDLDLEQVVLEKLGEEYRIVLVEYR